MRRTTPEQQACSAAWRSSLQSGYEAVSFFSLSARWPDKSGFRPVQIFASYSVSGSSGWSSLRKSTLTSFQHESGMRKHRQGVFEKRLVIGFHNNLTVIGQNRFVLFEKTGRAQTALGVSFFGPGIGKVQMNDIELAPAQTTATDPRRRHIRATDWTRPASSNFFAARPAALSLRSTATNVSCGYSAAITAE